MTKLTKKLRNPFLLVGQGFVLGAVLFFATSSETGSATTAQPVESRR